MQKKENLTKGKKGTGNDPIIPIDGAKIAIIESTAFPGSPIQFLVNTNCRNDLLIHTVKNYFSKAITNLLNQNKSVMVDVDTIDMSKLSIQENSFIQSPSSLKNTVTESIQRGASRVSSANNQTTEPTQLTVEIMKNLENLVVDLDSSSSLSDIASYDFIDVDKKVCNINTKLDRLACESLGSRRTYKLVKMDENKNMKVI